MGCFNLLWTKKEELMDKVIWNTSVIGGVEEFLHLSHILFGTTLLNLPTVIKIIIFTI